MEARIIETRKFNGVELKVVEFRGEAYNFVTVKQHSNNKYENSIKDILKYFGAEYLANIPLDEIRISIDSYIRVNGGKEITKPIKVAMNNECLVEKIKSAFNTSVDGRSGFDARNYLLIDEDPVKEKIVTAKIGRNCDRFKEIERYLEKYYDSVYWVENFFGVDYYDDLVLLVSVEEKEVESYHHINKKIDEMARECEKEFSDKVRAKYGDIIEGVEFGPFEEFEKLPNDYIEVYSERTKLTEDSRQGRTHTYAIWAVKKGVKGVVSIKLPTDAKVGKVIGRGGERIKRLAVEIGCKFIKLS